jgi:A1 cistron-splicing factor AAR2
MLLKIFLHAHLLPLSRPSLAAAFIRTLTAQLTYSASWLEGSILDTAESQTKDLRLSLTVYKRRLDEFLQGLGNNATPEQLAVATAFAGLEAVVTGTLDWDLRGDYLRRGKVMMEDGEEVELEVADLAAEDERGEWAPEIVDLDESGRQRDLVSWND